MDEKVYGRRYRLIEKIGSGGMAEVFKAVDETLGRTVAVKILHPRYAADPNFAARFRQEAQAAANLQSPYIVNIYDWGQEGDTYYIVMEMVRGTDLKTLIQQRGPMPSKRAAALGAQVCSALSVAHGYDVIHRDIKPHNIMVTPDGAAKVMDFGIARAGNTTMTQTGSVLGTAHYVSPEQAQGRPLAATSDLYSLGVVLYEAVTGRLPFNADTPVAVALKQVNDQPLAPSQIVPEIDPGLEAIILKAMSKQPSARYATAEEMRRDLLSVANGGEVTTVMPAAVPVVAGIPAAGETAVMPAVGASTSTHAGSRTPARRKPAVWPWILVAVLLIAAGLGVAWQMGLLGPQGSPIPNVVGKRLGEAQIAITEAGFTVNDDVAEEFSDKPEGVVIDQSPVAATTAEKGAVVSLTVSKGKELVTVPRIIGMNEQEAREALAAMGLVAEPLPDQYDAEASAGIVFRQTPDQNASVEKGSSVQYVVSRGKKTANVPDVRGETQANAQKILDNAGFKASIKEAYDQKIEKGVVISQNPAGGFEGVEGATVTIVVSAGPEFFPIPDVVGTSLQEALNTLKSAGMKPVIVYEPHQSTGTVLSQNPAADTMVKKNTSVSITVDAPEP